MRLLLSILLLCAACGQAMGQTISYFNNGFLRQGSAKLDREYLGIYGSSGTNYLPGTGINFTPSGPYAYTIDSTGGGGGSTNYVLKSGDVMTGALTNLLTMTVRSSNSTASINFEVPDVTPGIWLGTAISFGTNGFLTIAAPSIFNSGLYVDQFVGIHAAGIDASGVHFGDGSGLTNVPTAGLSITQSVLVVSLGATNIYTNVFANGLLVASGPAGAGHGPSILLENGSYLLLEGGGSLLKE